MSLLELFCAVDEFWQEYRGSGQGTQVESGDGSEGARRVSEIMTVLIYFLQSH